MHTGHLILIKAESHDDAISRVKGALEDFESNFGSNWSDWSTVGDDGFTKSRWNFHADFEDWNGASSHAVSLTDEADLFHKALDHFYAFRVAAFERLTNEISGYSLTDFKLDQNDQISWALFKFAKLAEAQYGSDSFVYDLENYTPDLRYFRQSTESGETDWYGVLVDFHF